MTRFDERFRKEGHAIGLAHRSSLDDAALDDVGNAGERDRRLGKFFRDDRAGRADGLADASVK